MLTGTSELMHLVGFLTGAVLYGMLVAMVLRPRARPEGFAISTGLLGLGWNMGELATHASRGAGFPAAAAWIDAGSFTALGFLASVVVHSVAHGRPAGPGARRTGAIVAVVVYSCAAVAGLLHLGAAGTDGAIPSPAGLTLLTIGLVAVIPALVALTRQQANSTRTLWMAAMAIVAVSSLHLGRFHGVGESWLVELGGHHASIVLAFAILYQDYRFALADLFLKQALTLLALVALVFGAYSLVEPALVVQDGALPPAAIAMLLALWATTALVFPWGRRLIAWFVDRVVLTRADYASLLGELAEDIQRRETAEAVLDSACRVLAPAVTATSISWHADDTAGTSDRGPRTIPVLTAEPPHYALVIGPLAGGRRLLSDDLAMLERAAVLIARRLDALRLTGERYERMLQEREMRTLATEAELRALRAQINPHFLFNALTTIGYLIQQAPPRALKTLMSLTTLLRSVLRSEGELTTLGRERELIDCYLKIERERFEERLGFTLDIPAHLLHVPVPSLIVQPLVENAVKHGIAGTRDGGTITVTAAMAGAGLQITVRNTGAPFGSAGEGGAGVGLENVRRRLTHYYGDEGWLRVGSDTDGATVAELRLPVAAADDDRLDELPRSAAR